VGRVKSDCRISFVYLRLYPFINVFTRIILIFATWKNEYAQNVANLCRAGQTKSFAPTNAAPHGTTDKTAIRTAILETSTTYFEKIERYWRSLPQAIKQRCTKICCWTKVLNLITLPTHIQTKRARFTAFAMSKATCLPEKSSIFFL
jgi:hypothetical protein